MNVPSILRHWFTLAATAASVWLIAALTLSAEDAHKLTEAFGQLLEPLIVIVTLLIAALWRIALAKGGELFRRGSGENDGNSAGGLSPCWIVVGVAAALMGALPSCAPHTPVTFRLIGPDGAIGYSSKGGLVISGTIHSEK